MPKTTRTFIAIPIPPTPGDKLTRLQNLLAPQVPAARWASTLPFHMTLAFLGDVPDTDLNTVCKAVAQACGPVPPFELRLEGVGAFPSPAKPRVLWAGLQTPEPTGACRAARGRGPGGHESRIPPRRPAIHTPCHAGTDQARSARPAAWRPDRDPGVASELVGGIVHGQRGDHLRLDALPGRSRLCPARTGSAHRKKNRRIILNRAGADDIIVFLRTQSRSP